MFTVKHICDDVYGFWEFYHNEEVISYLIIGDAIWILFDSGMGIYDLKKEIRKIYSWDLLVINSHHHFDHVGGNHQFSTILWLDHPLIQKAQKWYSHKEISTYFTPQQFTTIPELFDTDSFSIQPFTLSEIIYSQGHIDIGKYTFTIISTPGHSSDSLCLYEPNMWWLFAWDTIYDWPLYIHDKKAYIVSLSTLMALDITIIFPGHNTFSESKSLIENILKDMK